MNTVCRCACVSNALQAWT